MRQFIPPLITKHPFAWGLLCWIMVGAIGGVDYFLVHSQVGLAMLYLFPICIASWIGGRRFGISIVVTSVISWLIDRIDTFPHWTITHFAWNTAMEFVTWTFIVFLITELKRTLIVAKNGFYTFLDTALPPMFATDVGGELIFTNRQLQALFNHAQTINIQAIEQRFAPRDPTVVPTITNPQHYDVAECYDAVEDHWYICHSTRMPWVDGREVCFHALIDITPQKQAQALSRQQQERLDAGARLITLGGMASALAHELNQPLAAIVNYLQGSIRLLNTGNANPHMLLEAMEKASHQAERAGVILRYARSLTQRRDPQFAHVDINRIVTDLADMFKDSAQRHHIRFALDLSPASLPVQADRIMLEQLITNLVRNGIEAMYETPTDTRVLSISTVRNNADVIELQVADTGDGLPQELADNLFSPFFTTKSDGLGLGLNLCRSIAEAHHGRLWATSNGGRGTVFHLSLPAAPEEIAA